MEVDAAKLSSMGAFSKVKTLGKGSYGSAVLCTSKYDRRNYVIKLIDTSNLSRSEIEGAKREASLLRSLHHPNIVRYHASFSEKKWFCIVMEHCDGGDLHQKLQARKKRRTPALLSEAEVLNVFVQLVLGLKHVHDSMILHRDLKSQNVFLNRQGRVKLGDFGIAKRLDSTMAMAKTQIGTPFYLSPEICKDEPYNKKTDVWSLGCLLHEMCTLAVPFTAKSMAALVRVIMNSPPPALPRTFSRPLTALVKLLLEKDHRRRPSINDVLNVPIVRAHMAKLTAETLGRSSGGGSRPASAERARAPAAQRERDHARARAPAPTPREDVRERARAPPREAPRAAQAAREPPIPTQRQPQQRSPARPPVMVREDMARRDAAIAQRYEAKRQRDHDLRAPVRAAAEERRAAGQRKRQEAEQKKLDQLAEFRRVAFADRQRANDRLKRERGRAGSDAPAVVQGASRPAGGGVRAGRKQAARASSRSDAEEETLRALEKARRDVYEERVRLKQKYAVDNARKVTATSARAAPEEGHGRREARNRSRSEQAKQGEEDMLKALEQARRDAFEERKRLKEKYAQNKASDARRGRGQQQQQQPVAAGGRSNIAPAASDAALNEHRHARLQYRAASEAAERKSRAKSSEDAVLEALKQARILAFQERMQAQERYRKEQGREEIAHGGGRSKAAPDPAQRAAQRAAPARRAAAGGTAAATAAAAAAAPSASRADDHLDELRKARVEAYEERKRLKAKFGRGDGAASQQQQHQHQHQQRVVEPIVGETIRAGAASVPAPRARAKGPTAQESESEKLRQLTEARVAAFEERKRLQRKYSRGGAAAAAPAASAAQTESVGLGETVRPAAVAAAATAVSSKAQRDVKKRAASKDSEDAKLRQLAEARKAAYAERMALQRKFSSNGVAEDAARAVASSARASAVEVEVVATAAAAPPTAPKPKPAPKLSSAEEEARQLEVLRVARVDAFNERVRLQKQAMEAKEQLNTAAASEEGEAIKQPMTLQEIVAARRKSRASKNANRPKRRGRAKERVAAATASAAAGAAITPIRVPAPGKVDAAAVTTITPIRAPARVIASKGAEEAEEETMNVTIVLDDDDDVSVAGGKDGEGGLAAIPGFGSPRSRKSSAADPADWLRSSASGIAVFDSVRALRKLMLFLARIVAVTHVLSRFLFLSLPLSLSAAGCCHSAEGRRW